MIKLKEIYIIDKGEDLMDKQVKEFNDLLDKIKELPAEEIEKLIEKLEESYPAK